MRVALHIVIAATDFSSHQVQNMTTGKRTRGTLRNAELGDGWREIFLSTAHDAGATTSVAESVELGHSLVLVQALLTAHECEVRVMALCLGSRVERGHNLVLVCALLT